MHCHEVCSPTAHTGPKKTLVWLCARSWKIRLKVTQTFFLRSSQAMKVGAMGPTLKPNKLRANWRCLLHRDREKQDKWGQMWKWCSLFFSMFEESCTWNSFLPGQTVNQEFYLEILRGLRENVQRKSPELWKSGDWFLHDDNAPAQQLCLWPGIWPVWDGPSFPTHPIHRT